MKIDANIEFSDAKAKELGQFFAQVSVDMDYVPSDAEAVKDWVLHELQSQFIKEFTLDDFTVTNMDEILEELAYDEFVDKTA